MLSKKEYRRLMSAMNGLTNWRKKVLNHAPRGNHGQMILAEEGTISLKQVAWMLADLGEVEINIRKVIKENCSDLPEIKGEPIEVNNLKTRRARAKYVG